MPKGMADQIILTSDDPVLRDVKFKPFRSKVERRVIPFIPNLNEPQTIELKTPWGAVLTAKLGDLLISELDKPNDYWPVDAEIFEDSYVLIRPGYCVKRAVTLLAPLTDITNGNPDTMITVETLEGAETVRAGDFFLAKGVKGEIWPYPKDKVSDVMMPAE
jgi:hypothetical protein